MSERAFDAISRRAADAVSRRNSILALGGAALAAAVMAEPVTAKRSAKKQVKKRCRRQVAQCRNYFAGFCLGDPECEEALLPCCDPLAQCNAGGLLQCIFSCGCEGLPTPPES